MPADGKEKLEKVIATIQKRWGAGAIGRSSEQLDGEVSHIASGYRQLDSALGIGGIPRGRISELIGAPTSGKTTVALKIMVQAQALGGMAVYIDLERNFDPAYARHCGVLLERLALVHPFSAGQALDMLPDFAYNGGFDLLICDLPAKVQEEEQIGRKLSSTLGRLLAPLSKGSITLLFLTTLAAHGDPNEEPFVYPRQAVLPHFATLRLLFQKERWLYRQRDVHGFEARVTVVKNKLSAAGKQARIAILINGSPDGIDR
jgi:recombination protein RecA